MKEVLQDRFPTDITYSNMYDKQAWKQSTGTVHTRDTVFVTQPNDDGIWEQITLGTPGDPATTACNTACGGDRKVLGWGVDRTSFVKYQRKYQTPPVCYDEYRNIEEVHQFLNGIVKGLKKLPDKIVSDFVRLLSLRQTAIAGNLFTATATTANQQIPALADTAFTAASTVVDLGSASYYPTSKLTMDFLDNHAEDLLYKGYFANEFLPQGTFAITMDIQTKRNLQNQNKDTTSLLALPDFGKMGRYYEYGLMPDKVGNWVFKYDHEQLRFEPIGGGKLRRIWPYDNVSATLSGKKPQFSAAYKNASVAAYHVYNRDARTLYMPELEAVNSDMKFNTSRNMLGQWQWLSPDSFTYTDPNTGTACTYFNDTKNKGYFLGEYEIGMEQKYPDIEMWILALREPQAVTNEPRCAALQTSYTQTLQPYNNPFCASLES